MKIKGVNIDSTVSEIVKSYFPEKEFSDTMPVINYIVDDLNIYVDTPVSKIDSNKLAKSIIKASNEVSTPPEGTIISEESYTSPFKEEEKSDLKPAFMEELLTKAIPKKTIEKAVEKAKEEPKPKVKAKEEPKVPSYVEDVLSSIDKKLSEQVVEVIKDEGIPPAIADTLNPETNTSEEILEGINTLIGYAQRVAVKEGLVAPNATETTEVEVSNKLTEVEPESSIETFFDEGTSVAGERGGRLWKYTNKFDAKKGFDYVPIANIGNSNLDTKYENVRGIAHYILDADVSGEEKYINKGSKAMLKNQLSGKNAQNLGSTVTEFYFPVYTKKPDGKVNIKYLRKDEIKDKSKIMSPLRQYRYSDFDWNGSTTAEGFNPNTVSSVPTKNFYKLDGKDTNESHLIFWKEGGKGSYGRYGGQAIVFIMETDNGRVVVETSGSIDEIQETAKVLMNKYNIKEEDLLMGYHDVGSFSAKPKANKNGVLEFKRWKHFNNEGHTGGGLAIPM